MSGRQTLYAVTACLLLVVAAAPAVGAPSISSTSGTFSHGNSVTISGSSFGTKSTAAPLIYDDFDDGEAGSDLSWWSLSSSSGDYPKYSDTRSHNSDQCARANFENQYNCTAYKTGYDLDEVYVSYWVYWAKVSGDDSRNIKLARVTSDTSDYKTGTPSLGYTGFYTTSSIWYAFNGDDDGPDNDVQVWGSFVSSGSWHRIEMYGKISTINQDDGARGWWLDLSEVDYDDTFPTYVTATDEDSYRCIVMPFYVAHDAGGPHNIYYDDVYVDDTLSRVEIGDASTWSNCTQREHQVPTAWSSSSVTVDVNTGSMSNGTAYLYVVDSSGAVNSSGYQITIGSGTTYSLTVNSGSGDGNYSQGATPTITADTAPSGQDFDEWVGDTSGIASVTSSSTTLTMPAANQEVTATYTDKTWTLTVNSGTGDGNYVVGAVADIDADTPASGKQFDEWIGDTNGIASVTTADTTLTMPYANAEITATYEDASSGTVTTLIVNWGSSEGNNVYDFSDWGDPYLGIWTNYTSSGPDGLIGGWTGTGLQGAVDGSSETFAEDDQIKVTWYNSDTSSHTITPKISFDDPNAYGGTPGTWYDMTQLQCAAASSGTTTYTFTSGTAGDYALVNVCRYTNGHEEMIIDKIELVTPGAATYTLMVNSGTGDGDYAESAIADIDADAAPSGQDFDEWVGDTSGIASVTTADTTLTMPAANQEITATYADKTWTLTVNSGTGDGSYVVGTVQAIAADTAPSGQDFDDWTGDTAGIADVNDPTTTITMPYADAEITATYADKTWTLTVNSGTGDGSYVVGTIQAIAADTAPSGQDFDDWTGDTAGIADVNDPTTTITMPYADAEITATYADKEWTLTVNSGTGDGSYVVGTVQAIAADTAPSGQDFDDWTGDTAGIADVNDPTTTITMPYADAEITATYADKTWTLTVNNGTGDGSYVVGTVQAIAADAAPSGQEFDDWTGDTAGIADVNDPTTTITMPYADAEITATYADKEWTLTVNSGTGDGSYVVGAIADIDADAPASGKQFDAWTGDTAGIGDVNTADTTLTMPYADAEITATYTDLPASYTLTVNDGSGDGDYSPSTVVDIDADAASSGQFFDAWTGDTTNIADVNDPSTTLTMPAANQETTATYTYVVADLVSRYTFDIDARDTYGTNDGTLGNGASVTNDGTRGKVVTLDGSDDIVSLPTSGMTAGRSELTLSMWVKPDEAVGTNMLYDAHDEWYWQFAISQTTWYTRDSSTGTTGSRNNDLSFPALSSGQWQHVAFVYSASGDDKAVYIDGEESTSTSTSVDTLTSDRDDEALSALSDGTFYDGLIDDVRLYSRALNDTEIALLAEQTLYTLTVNSGTGDGEYLEDAVADIDADAAPSGQDFDQWVGDTSGIASVTNSSTTLTMLASNAEVTATYADKEWTLTVNSGTGDGDYVVGAIADIDADTPASGKQFDEWIGDTTGIASVTTADTTLTMPYADAEITATYADSGPTVTLIVNWGSSEGNNVYDFSDWGDPFLGIYTDYSSLGPDGLKAGWTGTGLQGAVDGSSESFSEGDQIKVTWYNSKTSSLTFTPKISFDDPNWYGGTPGTWYDMTELQCAAESSGTTTYTFTSSTAGSYSLVNVCRYTNGCNEMVLDKIELEQ